MCSLKQNICIKKKIILTEDIACLSLEVTLTALRHLSSFTTYYVKTS